VDKLHVAPCLPADWEAFKVHYRYRESVYHIDVLQTAEDKGGASVTVDGVERHDKTIPLVDDRQEHSVEVSVPRDAPAGSSAMGKAVTDRDTPDILRTG
jgi:cyclic beta-1,2-glucan synthetase